MSLISEVQRNEQTIVLQNAALEGAYIQDPYIKKLMPKSVFCIPIRREHFDGVLYMENNLASSVFTKERVEIIRLLAEQTAVAIENARLYEQVQDYSKTLEDKVFERTAKLEKLNLELQGLAERDGLTGVANRRRGDNYLNETWGRLRRENQSVSVIMMDVDHFKAYNDNYGHQAGDDCLVRVAEVMRSKLSRPADLIARYGGEEFMIILPNTELEGAKYVAEKICRAIVQEAIEHEFSSVGPVVTSSAGVASVIPTNQSDPEELLREADIALYRAKKMGRNQVQCAQR
jgi:diguanylate cyclase (GGDEF)-like protein